jgi:hypothetical protein
MFFRRHQTAPPAQPALEAASLHTGPVHFTSEGTPACAACGTATGAPSPNCGWVHDLTAGELARQAFLAAVDQSASAALAGKARHWSQWTLTRQYGTHQAVVPLSLSTFRGVVDLVSSAACGLPYTATVETDPLGVRAIVAREHGSPIVLTIAADVDRSAT